jgi:hypothetical protein
MEIFGAHASLSERGDNVGSRALTPKFRAAIWRPLPSPCSTIRRMVCA